MSPDRFKVLFYSTALLPLIHFHTIFKNSPFPKKIISLIDFLIFFKQHGRPRSSGARRQLPMMPSRKIGTGA
jgi:hypothetical protein